MVLFCKSTYFLIKNTNVTNDFRAVSLFLN